MRAKPTVILVAGALIAGLLVGFAASTIAYRSRWLEVPGRGPVQRMAEWLDLTAKQRIQVMQVIQSTRHDMRGLRRNFDDQRRQRLDTAYDQIRAILTPEQEQKFDRAFVLPAIRGRHHHHHHPDQ